MVLRMLEAGECSDNPRNELTWEFDLAPREERALTYRYDVYVRH